MADNLSFLLDKSVEHLEKGLDRQRQGNPKEASYHFLQSAEYLFKAARNSEPPLKELRIQRAEALLEKGKALAKLTAPPKTGQPKASEEAVLADTWLVQEKPQLKLSVVAGLDKVKEQIRIKMVYPFAHPELAKKFGIKKGSGVLLWGPPGTGKTMLAKAVAGEIDAAFYTVKPSEIMSKWIEEAEQNVAKLFAAARSNLRAVIFIDEVEALSPKRCDSHSTVMLRV